MVDEQGITNTLALPIDEMLYIYLLCPHSKHPKKLHGTYLESPLGIFLVEVALGTTRDGVAMVPPT
jgi:hypothetical protein